VKQSVECLLIAGAGAPQKLLRRRIRDRRWRVQVSSHLTPREMLARRAREQQGAFVRLNVYETGGSDVLPPVGALTPAAGGVSRFRP
jgi:hypothetical protein